MKVTKDYLKQIIKEEIENLNQTYHDPLDTERSELSGQQTQVEVVGKGVPDGRGNILWTLRVIDDRSKEFKVQEKAPDQIIMISPAPEGVTEQDIKIALANHKTNRTNF